MSVASSEREDARLDSLKLNELQLVADISASPSIFLDVAAGQE